MKDYKIKSFEDACTSEGVDPTKLPDVSMLPEDTGKWLINGYKLSVIIAAINREDNGGEKWEPDYSDPNQRKYYPWPWVKADKETPAGSGFSGFGCVGVYSIAAVGSRLCYRSYDAMEYGYRTFETELYKEYLLRI